MKSLVFALLVFLVGCSTDVVSMQTPISPVKTDKTCLASNGRSGCCSWHGGVCGCSGGRAMCCDGNPSPSCGC